MLVIAESDLVKCGAVVGSDGDNTVIVFHPALSYEQRMTYAQELLGPEHRHSQVRVVCDQVTLAS